MISPGPALKASKSAAITVPKLRRRYQVSRMKVNYYWPFTVTVGLNLRLNIVSS